MNRFFYYYLFSVPFLAAAIGFGLGGIPDKLTIPLWIVHSLVLVYMFNRLKQADRPTGQNSATGSTLLFIPWVLFTIFAGFGPPPETPALWLAAVSQQQVRYFILALGAVISANGFSMLSIRLSVAGQSVHARTALTLTMIATPLYVLNMLYWGFYLPRAFAGFNESEVDQRPDWYLAMRELFGWVGTFSTALLYAATWFFVAGLFRAGLLPRTSAWVYLILSALACGFCFVPADFPAPLNGIGYFVSIPAICFIIPYLISLRLATSQNVEGRVVS